MQHLLRGAVRPVIWTGQTGRRAERRRSDERSPGRDPVGASAYGCPRLGRPDRVSSNAMETREEQRVEVGKARVKKKGKDDKR